MVRKLGRVLRGTAVVIEQALQPLSALDGAVFARILSARIDQLIFKALVIPLVMVVLGVLPHGSP